MGKRRHPPSTPALPKNASSLPQRSKIEAPSRSSASKSRRFKGTSVASPGSAGPERANFVVELLEAALRAGKRHHVRARRGERDGRGAANAAGGAGHQRDAGRSVGLRRTQSTLLTAFARLALRGHGRGRGSRPGQAASRKRRT